MDKRGRTARKRSSICRRRWLQKGRQFLSGKIGVTPSVAAPGDTYSDATFHLFTQRTRFAYSCA